MDETIITNWNKVVKEKDLVYHLGDFMSWKEDDVGSNFFAAYNDYRLQLNGKIFLVIGNHDKRIGSPFPHNLTGKIALNTLRFSKKTIVMCHYAMRVWEASHFDSWHIYGHSHGGLEPFGKSWDVGVDNNNFTPISFDDLYKIMESRPHNYNWLKRLPGYNNTEFEKERARFNAQEDSASDTTPSSSD